MQEIWKFDATERNARFKDLKIQGLGDSKKFWKFKDSRSLEDERSRRDLLEFEDVD